LWLQGLLHHPKERCPNATQKDRTMIVIKDESADHSPSDKHFSERTGAPAWRADLPGISPVSGFPHRPLPCKLAAVTFPAAGRIPDHAWKATGPLSDAAAPTRLLVADTDAERADQLAGILAFRYEVQTVHDGEAALVAMLANGPDVVLADLALLRRRHFKMLRALKAGAGTCHIPVIATASGAGDETLDEALEAGVDDFLLKPFSRSELFARIGAARARRAAAEARRDGEDCQRTLRTLLDTLDDGVFVAQDRRLVACNRALAAMLGYTEEGCTGLSFEAVVAPEELALWSERYRCTVGDGPEPCGRYETAFLRQGGERLALDISIRRIRHDGRAAMLGILRDTSGRRQLEAAQRRLIRMIEASQDFVALSEPDGKLIYVNGAGRRLLGLTAPDEPVSVSIAEHLAPRSRELVLKEAIPAALQKGSWTGETALLGRNGAEIPVSQMILAHRNGTGAVEYLSTVARDLSERIRAEEALRESEERFRRVVQQAPIPVFVRAWDGQVLETSSAVAQLTGWTRDDIPDARSWYLKGRRVPADKIEAELEEDRQRFLRDEPPEPRAITVWTRFDEPRLWLVQDSAPMRLPDGRLLLASMAIDLTERRRAEEELRAAERQKDEFIAMLAHELRNPLAPIRNAAQALREPQLAAPELQWVRDVIDRQVAQMSRLMDDLLDVSRVTHGILTLRRAPVDLAEVLDRAVETCRPIVSFRRHVLRQVLPGEPVQVEGDLSRLVQVFSNLLDNAAKYTDIGGHIDIILEATPGEALVRVRDNGRGIAAELLPRIFDVFTQDSRSLDRTQGGLGLGLALVRRLVEMHGGRVEAHSGGTGRGTEFVVRLSRLASAAPAEGPGAEGEGLERKPAVLRILVVDDNVDSADSMALLLSLDGHEVRTAFDGPGALTEAADFQPRAVLLDIGLPGMDGYEVARRMRELPGLRDVLMIAITGYGQEDDRTRSKAAGFDHHLVKPVDPEALSRLLGALI
jgi:PAS domain S-box-containing protein